MSDPARRAAANLTAVRRDKPLIHNITNFVVMNATANALLASGASPRTRSRRWPPSPGPWCSISAP
jgi:hypothetical protein